MDPRKKLIVFACSAFRPDTVGANLADLRSEHPGLAGLVIHFWPDDWKYIHMGGRQGLFCPRRYEEKDFRKTIDDLDAVDFGPLKHNFFRITTTVGATPEMPATKEETLNIDWFDERWSAIADNMALYAQLARDVGFKGLMLDFEEYPQTHNPLWQLFRYKAFRNHREQRGLPEKTFEEYVLRVRECGRLMASKMTDAYPDMTLLMIPDTGWPGHDHYDLLPAFVDGILEGAGPDIKLIDGISRPVIKDDEIWFFYDGVDGTHFDPGCFGNMPRWEQWMKAGDTAGKPRLHEWREWNALSGAVGLAKLRLDGFAHLEAPEVPGIMDTKPFVISGTALAVNAAVAGGEVRVEIRDEAGRPIEGYALEDCDRFVGDAVRHVVAWRGETDLTQMRGTPVQLRFWLRLAKLYSFHIVDGGRSSPTPAERVSSALEAMSIPETKQEELPPWLRSGSGPTY